MLFFISETAKEKILQNICGTPLALLQIPANAQKQLDNLLNADGLSKASFTLDGNQPSNEHSVETEGEVGWVCKNCRQVFTSDSALAVHQTVLNHSMGALKLIQLLYLCKICNVTSMKASEFQLHLKSEMHKAIKTEGDSKAFDKLLKSSKKLFKCQANLEDSQKIENENEMNNDLQKQTLIDVTKDGKLTLENKRNAQKSNDEKLPAFVSTNSMIANPVQSNHSLVTAMVCTQESITNLSEYSNAEHSIGCFSNPNYSEEENKSENKKSQSFQTSNYQLSNQFSSNFNNFINYEYARHQNTKSEQQLSNPENLIEEQNPHLSSYGYDYNFAKLSQYSYNLNNSINKGSQNLQSNSENSYLGTDKSHLQLANYSNSPNFTENFSYLGVQCYQHLNVNEYSSQEFNGDINVNCTPKNSDYSPLM